jgi:multidrug efflux pump subunit AcrA (membrane-fusion protein)
MDVNATPTQGTLSYRARIRVPNPSNELRGGMLVSVNVRSAFHPGAIVVPRTAVFQSESGSNVFTVVDLPQPPGGAAGGAGGGGGKASGGGKAAGGGAQAGPPVKLMQAKVVPVQIGLQTDTLAEIRSPEINPGTTVITTRPDALQDKSTVAIAQPRAGGRGGAQ